MDASNEPSVAERVLSAAVGLEQFARGTDYAGYDPYDGLNATRFGLGRVSIPLLKRLVIQVNKRSPVNLRPLLGIQPTTSSKALGVFAGCYFRLTRLTGESRFQQLGVGLLDRLVRMRSPDWAEACWGYPFDVQTRWIFYDKRTPTLVATAFIAQGFLDAHEFSGDARYLDVAHSSARFIARDCRACGGPAEACLSYTPTSATPVHNANALGAALLARVAHHTGDAELRAAASAAIGYTLDRQRADGAWVYGESPGLAWVDSIHTCFVLESLAMFGQYADDSAVADPIDAGLRFFTTRLLREDGLPMPRVDSERDVDVRDIAEAVKMLVRVARTRPEAMDTATALVEKAVLSLQLPDGSFYYRLRGERRVRMPYPRWVSAPMLAALTCYLVEKEPLRE